MDIRLDGKRALVTGAGKGKFTSFLRLQRPKSTCKPKQEMSKLGPILCNDVVSNRMHGSKRILYLSSALFSEYFW